PENSEESTGGNREAIAIRLNAARLTGHAEKKEIVFIYLPGRFYAATQLVDLSTAEHTKGGIRYAEPQARANDPKQRNITEVGFDIVKGAYEDLNNLSNSQYPKNVLAGIGYAGAKTYFGVHQDAVSIKDDNLRSWARAMVDVGLMEVYDGGPDVGMSSANQETIIAGINRRYTRHLMNEIRSLLDHKVDVFNLNLSTYGEALAEIERKTGKIFLNDSLIGFMRKRLLLALPKGKENGSLIMEKVFTTQLKNEIGKIIGSAVTGGSAKVGAISHVELAVTGDSTWHSIKAILDYKALDPTTLKTAVVGAGDVGGSIALKMARQGLKVIAISDINGVVHKPAGFTVAELQNLNNTVPGKRNVLTWMPEQPGVEHLRGPDILDKNKVDIDLLVPAAMGGLINAKSIELLRKAEDDPTREPLIIIEGSNNAFVGMEEELKKRGILAVSGMSVNFGGVKGSTKEAMAKHQLTVRELREILLQPTSGDPVPTAINTDVTERITVKLNESGTELGTVVVHNGLVVAKDMEEITLGSNLDPLNGRLYNRGDDLGYSIVAMQRRLAWNNFVVVQDLEGRVNESNHPNIPEDEVFDFLDPLDQIKLELYDEIQQIARRNNTMVMELATKFDMTPTEAVVRLAKALGQRKADIYAATEGSDLVQREAIVKQFKSQGFFMVDHIMRNIAAIQIASQSDLILELIQTAPSTDTPELATTKTTIRFDANGYIVADEAMTAELSAAAQPLQTRRQTRSMVVQALTNAETSAEINEAFVDA
ncbi:MAG: hypothetical protein K8I00_06320, partial [Candidatus Omnitrophica bacterium]|nr:hypothetical protein [Candidatus Omnitrophota bacterium]